MFQHVPTLALEPNASKLLKLFLKKNIPCLIMHSEAATNPDAIDSNFKKNVCKTRHELLLVATGKVSLKSGGYQDKLEFLMYTTVDICRCFSPMIFFQLEMFTISQCFNFSPPSTWMVLHGWYTPRLDGSTRKIPVASVCHPSILRHR